MFKVIDVRHPFLFWTSVELRAECDMVQTDKQLRMGGPDGAPEIRWRRLDIKEGETVLINAWRWDGYRIGDEVPLGRVVRKLPIHSKWRTVATV